MIIDKAIKVLTDYKMESAFNATPEFEEALKLGIEALLLIRRLNFNKEIKKEE